MKKIFIFIIFTYAVKPIFCQRDSSNYQVGWGTLDYAIPESPAFKILGTNPDNIIKPTQVRKIAFSVADYFYSSGGVIPKNLAVEVSPLLLINAKASLYDYNKSWMVRFLYRLRLSLGTTASSNGSYGIAEGIRMTLHDRTDLLETKNYPGYIAELNRIDILQSKAIDSAIQDYCTKNKISPVEASERFKTDTAFKNMIRTQSKNFYSYAITMDSLAKYRDAIRDSGWNKSIWEIGIASLQSSPDSLIKNIQFSQIALWMSYTHKLGSKAQILIGGKAGFMDSIQWNENISAGLRFYYGGNNIKGYLQGEYDYKNKNNSLTAGLGFQFNIINGIWGEFAVNLVIDNKGNVSYKPALNIGIGTPQKKRK